MSLIFGYENPRCLTVAAAVIAKGLNKLQCVLSSLSYFAVPDPIQNAYKTYVGLLPAYMKAMATGLKQSATTPFHPLTFPNDRTIPYTYPNLSVAFPQEPTMELMDIFKSHGFEKSTIRGQQLYLFLNPSTELIHAIMSRTHNETAAAPDTFVNTHALRFIALVRRVFSAFYKTHNYPAFVDPEHMSDVTSRHLSEETQGKRKTTEGISVASKRSRFSSAQPLAAEEGEIEMITEEPATSYRDQNKIMWALPSGSLDSVGWGEPSLLPSNTYGIYVPYVPELIGYDHRITPAIMVKYFAGCLGSTTEEIQRMVTGLRTAWGVVCKTEVGKILNHQAVCIDLALQAQARAFPIYSGGYYEGTVLAGYGFTVSLEKDLFTPVAPLELAKIIQQTGSSSAALKAIAEICGLMDTEWRTGSYQPTSMMEVRKKVLSASITENQRDEVLKLANQLRCRRSWALNPSTLIRGFEMLTVPIEDLPDDLPIHPTMLFEKDPVDLVWSCFGDMAPSPRFDGRQKMKLSDANFPKHIGFAQRVLPQAISDVKDVLNSKMMAVPSLNRRSAVHKDRVFERTAASDILGAIRKAANSPLAGVGNTGTGMITEGSKSNNALLEFF